MAKKRDEKIEMILETKVMPYLYEVRKYAPIERAYIFGSWTKKKQRRNSDIDVCVVSSAFTTWDKTVKSLSRSMRQEWSPIEPHGMHTSDFKPSENPVAYEVVKHGIRII